MSAQTLDTLLQHLSAGDDAAAEQLFRAYEPYLRKVVRRQLPAPLRAKFDSIDVVQSVWAHVLQGFREAGWRFTSPAQLRAFLATVTRNRLTDRVRHFHYVLDHERRLGEDENVGGLFADDPRPSEVAQARDLWERMLALCPPEYHELLRLKRQGLLLNEIADRTGLHEGSVRRILRRLARQLAFESSEA
jgi:RNA polymerase sigma-70 factor (ECF subfamily)